MPPQSIIRPPKIGAFKDNSPIGVSPPQKTLSKQHMKENNSSTAKGRKELIFKIDCLPIKLSERTDSHRQSLLLRSGRNEQGRSRTGVNMSGDASDMVTLERQVTVTSGILDFERADVGVGSNQPEVGENNKEFLAV